MSVSGHRYFVLNKPYNMVSQFVSSHAVPLLSELDFPFPEGTHAIGRLDGNSEGMLLLTTNKKVTRLLFQGEVPHKRTYLVKVAHAVQPETVELLRKGIPISASDGGWYTTAPCEVDIVPEPADLFHHAFETPDFIPHTWLRISLTEGRYHQVRKMVAAVRHKCKRLIRTEIEDLTLGSLQPGEVQEWDEMLFFERLKIANWQ
ncbi:23S rRNA pseudouridine2457 synthase [Filimonas zeae]|uniref:Pseudouridine synthase n=1 Tax=Filimonas zeae TaxID=1737353 RepID=A0A917MZ39_9BACT|nr:pseudouridine synthase [Filimonas zeae]MDR6342262.1 23S rRNA pseudouridine2457 synthase [Filimonas zeae]GGH80636.1 pseudouridine synthase [Filimonas zeae]